MGAAAAEAVAAAAAHKAPTEDAEVQACASSLAVETQTDAVPFRSHSWQPLGIEQDDAVASWPEVKPSASTQTELLCGVDRGVQTRREKPSTQNACVGGE